MKMMKSFYAFSLALLVGGATLPVAVSANQSYQTTEQGLQYKVIKASKGKKPVINDEVEIRFKSYNEKGELFEGTLNNVPVVLPVRDMFSGLQQSLMMMPVGSVYEFNIPEHLGYQEEGSKSKKSVLYRIELLKINP